MFRPLVPALLLTLAAAPACEKGEPAAASSNAPAAAVASDPVEAAADMLLATLAAGDRDTLLSHTISPLTDDLSAAAFDDLSKTIAWLGYVKEKKQRSDVPVEGGTRRAYSVEFEKGTVETEITVVDGKVMGFHFRGDDFIKAEHGTIADQFRHFKVYDFWFEDGGGGKIPEGQELHGPTLHYHLVVGGIEAFGGKHHVGIEKMLHDADGKELFKRPVEFDTQFSENAEGIPRGEIGGNLDVPGPGEYELLLLVSDDIAAIDTEYRIRFKVAK